MEKVIDKPISFESRSIVIPIEGALINGRLTAPKEARGLVVIIQGSDRVRDYLHSDIVEKTCNRYWLATLRLDFTNLENKIGEDNSFLIKAIEAVSVWLQKNKPMSDLNLGFFSIDVDVTAMIEVAIRQPELVKALVLRGGRPDRAEAAFSKIKAPVLMIAAGRDPEGIRANQSVLEKLNSASALHVIPRASYLFEESDARAEADQLAALWFSRYLE